MQTQGQLRPLRNECERKRWNELYHYAFYADKTEDAWKEWLQEHPAPENKEDRGYFVEGEMVSTCSLLSFEVRLRGSSVVLGGLADISTPPEHRRQGHCEKTLYHQCDEMRRRGINVSALWPFSRSFYREFGWATASEATAFKLNPEDLRDIGGEITDRGNWNRVKACHWETLREIRQVWAEPYDLTYHRSQDWWEKRIFKPFEGNLYAYCHRDTEGAADAYVIYTVTCNDRYDYQVKVADMAFTSPKAYRAILQFLHQHDSQASEYHLLRPMDDPLFRWLKSGKVTRGRGIMFRVVDIAAAVESVSYPADLSAEIFLEIEDDLTSWNAGLHRITVRDGEAAVRSAEDVSDAQVVRTDIGAFSQIFAGYVTASELHRGGEVDVQDESTLGVVDEIFPSCHPFMREYF